MEVKDKKYIEQCYFHALAGFVEGDVFKLKLNVSLQQLESILKLGAIYSRNNLSKYGVNILEHKAVFNTDDYISVSIKNPSEKECEEWSGFYTAYENYMRHAIAIIISSNIPKSEFRNGVFEYFPGERQIRDKISTDKFVGILVDFIYDNFDFTLDVAYLVYDLLDKYNIDLNVYDGNYNLIKRKTI